MSGTTHAGSRHLEPAQPFDNDPRVKLSRQEADRGKAREDVAYDAYSPSYSGLFHRADIPHAVSDGRQLPDSVDFTPPATSFKLSDVWGESFRKVQSWKRKKQLHHDTGLDYTGSNRSSAMTRWRTDVTHCQCIIQLFDPPEFVQREAVNRAMHQSVNPFNAHYDGYIGAVLSAAIVSLADGPVEFERTEWNDRLHTVLAQLDVSFEAEKLVDFAFRTWGCSA